LGIAVQRYHTATAALLLFAIKLSSIPDHRFSLPTIMTEDPKIEQILKCYEDNLFKGLRDNLNLIAQADKAGLSPAENNSPSFTRRVLNIFNLFQATETRSTSQIVLSALYDQFGRSKNIEELLQTFNEKISKANLSRFKLNDRQSLLTFLLPKQITNAGLNDKELKVADKLSSPTIKKNLPDLPEEVFANIAEYTGAFSDRRLTSLLKAYFNGDKVKDLVTLAKERSDPTSVTDVESEGFASRVGAGNKQDKCCIVM
jgi:hypothetical protein